MAQEKWSKKEKLAKQFVNEFQVKYPLLKEKITLENTIACIDF